MSGTPKKYDLKMEMEHRLRMLERDLQFYKDMVQKLSQELQKMHYCEKCKTLINLRK